MELAEKNASNTQTAYGIRGHILSATHFLDLYKKYEGLQKAIVKVIPNIGRQMSTIHKFIEQIPEVYYGEENKKYVICSANRKKLFLIQLKARYDDLLVPYYD